MQFDELLQVRTPIERQNASITLENSVQDSPSEGPSSLNSTPWLRLTWPWTDIRATVQDVVLCIFLQHQHSASGNTVGAG